MTVDVCIAYTIILVLKTLNLTLTLKTFVRLVPPCLPYDRAFGYSGARVAFCGRKVNNYLRWM